MVQAAGRHALVVALVPDTILQNGKKAALAGGAKLEDFQPVVRPFVGGLSEVLANVGQSGFVVLSKEDVVKTYGKDIDAVWREAFRETADIAQPISIQETKEGFEQVEAENGLSPFALLEDAIWSSPSFAGRGRLVVLVDKRYLIAGHTGNPHQLAVLKQLVGLGADADNLIAKTLLVRTPNGWATYPDHH